jgi:asparagine synthase (glutamine-hydrolysing)
MCGIAGFIDFKYSTSSLVLEQMTNTMEHRGPDGKGFFLENTPHATVGLGHRRLAIIDVSEGGHQPMLFDNLVITFNGEIYNFKEVRAELQRLGRVFTTQSDTEVILQAYQQWGEQCLAKFRGMFALVIYNRQNQTVFLARDRAGVKPLFCYHHGGVFLFASELKAFHVFPHFVKQINPSAVAAFMQYGNVPEPHCIFNHCFKVKPGSYITLHLATGEMTQAVYWNVYDAYNQPKLKIDFEEAKIETEKILTTAFQYRMVADVPVGVFLSGGYDSASVAAILQKNSNRKIKTFTIGVPDAGLNEAPFAKEVARHLGTDHTELYCTEKEMLALVDNLPYFYDEPFGDSSAIPTTLVSQMARQSVTVALSADAGDEVFAGYNRYDFLMKYRARIQKIPRLARTSMAGLMNAIPANKIPVLKNRYNFHNRYEKLKGIIRDPSPQRIMLSLSEQYTPDQLKQLLVQVPPALQTAYQSTELNNEFYTPLSYMMAIDYQTYLLDDILQKVDRATMSASLEGREPFLDHTIIEWAARLPDDFKYHQGIKKYILKQIVHQYIPSEMMERPKMGFAIPINHWLHHQLRGYIHDFLNEEVVKKQGLFNWEFVSQLKNEFLAGKKEYELKVWYMLMFQMWYKKWMA